MENVDKIVLNNVTKTFKERNSNKVVIDDLSFTFERGNFYVIKGRSGCGKSTLTSLIGLLDSPTSGEILFNGKAISKNEIDNYRAENISFCFQDNNTFDDFLGIENLNLVSSDESKIKEITDYLSITSLLNKKVRDYSKGESSRLAIARVILEDKAIMIFDEPTGNLDKANTKKVMEKLKELSKTHLVIVIAHDFSEEENNLFATVLHMMKGKVTINEIYANEKENKELSSFSKILSIRYVFKLFISFLKNHKFVNFLSLVISFVMTLILCVLLSLNSFNYKEIIVPVLNQYEITSVSVDSDAIIDNGYRLFSSSASYNEQSFNITIAYSQNPHSSFYGEEIEIKDDEIIIPQFKADQYNVADGDVITLGVSTLSVKVIDYDYTSHYEKLLEVMTTSNAQNTLEESTPCLVNINFIKKYIEDNIIKLNSTAIEPIYNILNINKMYDALNCFYAKTSTREGNGLILTKLDSFIPEISEEKILSFFNDKAVKLSNLYDNTYLNFDLGTLTDEIKFDYVEFGESEQTTTIVLSQELSNKLVENCFPLGVLSSHCGPRHFQIPQKEFYNSITLNSSFYGLIPNQDLQKMVDINQMGPFFLIGAFIMLFFITISSYFYIFSLRRGSKNTSNLLVAIGFNKSTDFKIDVMSCLGVIILPIIIATFIIYPALADIWSTLTCKAIDCNAYIPFSRLNVFSFIVPVIYILLLILVLYLRSLRNKNDLLNTIKISKE